MRKSSYAIGLVVLLFVAACGPVSQAEYTTKSEYTNPQEVYFDVEGPTYDEDKEENRSGGESSSLKVLNVSVAKKTSSSESESRDTVTFPYSRFDWTIWSWYPSSYGLRFYNVYYKDEKILFDYRLPWIEIDSTKYALSSGICVDGPDLSVWPNQEIFKVWAKYEIQSKNVQVEVYVYFFGGGLMEPWAIVDCNDVDRNITVPQRFDFDLDGADDDNADFFVDGILGPHWKFVDEEDHLEDAGNPNQGGVQWALYDSDQVGITYDMDQIIDIFPYATDDSDLTVLRYHSSQISGDPADYDNDETTGLYSGATYDPYTGYDLVAWYVARYTDVDWCNPGPWIFVEV